MTSKIARREDEKGTTGYSLTVRRIALQPRNSTHCASLANVIFLQMDTFGLSPWPDIVGGFPFALRFLVSWEYNLLLQRDCDERLSVPRWSVGL